MLSNKYLKKQTRKLSCVKNLPKELPKNSKKNSKKISRRKQTPRRLILGGVREPHNPRTSSENIANDYANKMLTLVVHTFRPQQNYENSSSSPVSPVTQNNSPSSFAEETPTPPQANNSPSSFAEETNNPNDPFLSGAQKLWRAISVKNEKTKEVLVHLEQQQMAPWE